MCWSTSRSTRRPTGHQTASVAGPTFGLEEHAGRKVIALFDRGEARDFADVYVLAQRYDKDRLLAWAAEVDAGFSLAVFADMTGAVSRFGDDELPVNAEETAALRKFFTAWAAELRTPES
ncbi:nucleotidyl transferase AbiEii/AbiGii toxin family protein [Kribbella sp. NPDC050470]|uniref:nucleotidyl transferase AbiEii/AbiGii toxin family protein n=1 Tax=unclassified Kribbella TaxID=2644121 RepID=UPI0037B2048A